MINRIKILFLAGLIAGFIYSAEENIGSTITQGIKENHFITIQLEDGQVELNKEQWELLLGSSETLQDMLSAIKEVGPSLPLSAIKKKTFEILLKVLDQPASITTLTFAQQLDLWGCANFLWIPSLLSPLDKVIAQGLSENKDAILTRFTKNPLEVIKSLELKHRIDMASSVIGYAMIKPYISKLWEVEEAIFDVIQVAWSPDGGMIASGSIDGTIRIRDVKNWEILRTIKTRLDISSIEWNPNSKMIAAGSWKDGVVRIWDTQNKKLEKITGNGGMISSVAWSSDGARIATGSDNNTVRIWNVQDKKLLHIFSGHSHNIESVAWSPDDRMIAFGSDDGTVRIWDVNKWEELHILQHERTVLSAAWSPDSTMIVSGSLDGNVRIWNTRNGELLRTFTGHKKWVNSVAWSPDGTTIASGSLDGNVRIWNAHSGELLHTFEGSAGPVAWSSRGTMLASVASFTRLFIWDMHPLFFISRITLLDALIIITTLKNPARFLSCRVIVPIVLYLIQPAHLQAVLL